MGIDILSSGVILILLIGIIKFRLKAKGKKPLQSEVEINFSMLIMFTLLGGLIWGYLKYTDIEAHSQMSLSIF